MPEENQNTIPKRISVLRGRVRKLKAQLKEVEGFIEDATNPPEGRAIYWQAVGTFATRKQSLQNDIDEARLQLAEWEDTTNQIGRPKAEDYTAEEWRQMIQADAQTCPDADLQIYLHEALQRTGYSLVVDGDTGALSVVRRAS
jgi:uncharacterized protein YydD (DUF2326 family)